MFDRRKISPVLLFVVLMLVSACSLPSPENTMSADVTEVVDGDTIKVKIGDREETVRFLLVDTPETVHPSKPVQPFGPEASDFVKETLEGRTVELEKDVSERDKYGRFLAYVYIDGESIQKKLLERGLARVAYVYEPNVKYVDEYRAIQEQAQKEGKGIWSVENYVQEDGFHGAESNTNGIERGVAQFGDDSPEGTRFVASKNSDVYHEIGCPGGADRIKEENAVYFATEEEARASGREMCRSSACSLQ